MKQIISIVILILAFSIVSFAQKEVPEIPVCSGLPFDNFGKLQKYDLYGRLDNFFVALRNDPGSHGFFILELGKNEPKAKRLRTLNEISKHLNYRKIDRSRLIFLIIEADEEYTKMHIVPLGAKITQVISESEEKNITRGEDFDRKIKELFTKK